jgi:hypothetical protein
MTNLLKALCRNRLYQEVVHSGSDHADAESGFRSSLGTGVE